MEATRRRFESLVEWALAVAFIAAVLGLGSVFVREIRTVNAVTPVIAREPDSYALQFPPGFPRAPFRCQCCCCTTASEVRVGDTSCRDSVPSSHARRRSGKR